jgi:hypothetical protein
MLLQTEEQKATSTQQTLEEDNEKQDSIEEN